MTTTHRATFIEREDALVDHLAKRFDAAFAPRARVAIKLHMGEPGNPYALAAPFVKRIGDCLRDAGREPFLFDTPVTYESPRGSAERYLRAAADRGFDAARIGFPVVVSNRSVEAKGRRMSYGVAADLVDADGVLLLTHVKGHLACGFGGAIKNVGMGCLSRETKGAIHRGGEPVHRDGCTACGACVEACPTGNVVLESDRPTFGKTWCPGCSNCVIACPAGAIEARVDLFDELLAEGAVLAHERFRSVFCVNVLRGIAKHCDCVADAGPIVAPDIGFVCAPDMLTADVASLEMVRERTKREDLFAEVHGHSPWLHVRTAARLMGRDTAVAIGNDG